MAGPQFTVVPDLMFALFAQLPDVLEDVEVSLSDPAGLSSGDYLGIGVTDPEANSPSVAATGNIEWRTSMTRDGFDDVGDISLSAWSVNGSDDMAEVIANVFAISAAVGRFVVDNYSDVDLLGVTGLWELHLSSYELSTFRIDGGCTAYLLFRLAYQATTP